MHARVAIYQLTGGTADEVINAARTGMLPIFQAQPGFLRYGVAEPGDGTILSISLWASSEAAGNGVAVAADYVASALADKITLRSNVVGDLAFFEGALAAV